jgi:hypothetical protein
MIRAIGATTSRPTSADNATQRAELDRPLHNFRAPTNRPERATVQHVARSRQLAKALNGNSLPHLLTRRRWANFRVDDDHRFGIELDASVDTAVR